MSKFTDEEREEAIEACAMMASSDTEGRPGFEVSYFGDAIDTNSRAATLAREALWESGRHRTHETIDGYEDRSWWAEAEVLLRDGWSPGEELVRL